MIVEHCYNDLIWKTNQVITFSISRNTDFKSSVACNYPKPEAATYLISSYTVIKLLFNDIYMASLLTAA